MEVEQQYNSQSMYREQLNSYLEYKSIYHVEDKSYLENAIKIASTGIGLRIM